MQIISRIFLVIGIIFICLGVLPWLVAYPYSDGPGSGPQNLWETIVMTAYDGQVLLLILGVLLVIGELFLLYKQKQLSKK